MTVFDNLAFGLRNRRLPKEETRRRVAEAAGILELEPLLRRKPKQLSGGQRQRVALGRAIVREPAAFLMDEPLSNLDASLRVQTRAEIMKLQNRLETTTIYVTHDQIEAMTMGDRIAVMNLGVLQQIGTPRELYTTPANTFVATFIGSPAMNLVPSGALGVGIGGADRLVGFRPEHVQLGDGKPDSAHWQATVEVVQYLGDEQLAYLRLGDAEIVAKLPLEAQLEAGREEEFAVPFQKLLLFDAETGNAAGPQHDHERPDAPPSAATRVRAGVPWLDGSRPSPQASRRRARPDRAIAGSPGAAGHGCSRRTR